LLGSWPAHRWTATSIEQPELDPAGICRPTDHATERVDLPNQVTLGQTSDRRVARHACHGIEAQRHDGGFAADAGRCRCRLAAGVAATVTPQHLLMDRNDLFRGGLQPHHYCLPVLKRSHHRERLLDVIASGSSRFFLGTDSAPHSRSSKEAPCGCAGIYTAHAALALYAEAFESAGALDQLEGFASHYGPDFYGLPRNTGRVTLVRDEVSVPEHFPFGGDDLVPLRAGGTVAWRLEP
jgi:dihydroorotase (homodimeric type)